MRSQWLHASLLLCLAGCAESPREFLDASGRDDAGGGTATAPTDAHGALDAVSAPDSSPRGHAEQARVEVHVLLGVSVDEDGYPVVTSHHPVLSGSSSDDEPQAVAAEVDERDGLLWRLGARASRYFAERGAVGFAAFDGYAPFSPHAEGVVRLARFNDSDTLFFSQYDSFVFADMEAFGHSADVFCHELAHGIDHHARGYVGVGVDEAVADLAAMHCGLFVDPQDDPWRVNEGADRLCRIRDVRHPLPGCGGIPRIVRYDSRNPIALEQRHAAIPLLTLAIARAHDRYGMSLRATEVPAFEALLLGYDELPDFPTLRDFFVARIGELANQGAQGSVQDDACAMALGFRDVGLTGEYETGSVTPLALRCTESSCPLCDAVLPIAGCYSAALDRRIAKGERGWTADGCEPVTERHRIASRECSCGVGSDGWPEWQCDAREECTVVELAPYSDGE